MQWFLWGLVVLIVGLAALVAAGRFGGMPATAVHDSPIPEFPADRDLDGDDLRRTRFAITTRGYSMAQVDDLLDRLATQLGGRPENPPPEQEPTEQEPTEQEPDEQESAPEQDAFTVVDEVAEEPTPEAPHRGWRGFSTLRTAAKSVASPSELAGSAIMEPDVSQQPGEEGEHGSNEAPHG